MGRAGGDCLVEKLGNRAKKYLGECGGAQRSHPQFTGQMGRSGELLSLV